MSATQYKRVVLEGPVRNRQDGTFYIGSNDRFIDANLIDTTDSHVKSVEDIPAPGPTYLVGDIVRTARGSVAIRTTHKTQPWTILVSGPTVRGWYPGDRREDDRLMLPLTLLSRNGSPVVGQ